MDGLLGRRLRRSKPDPAKNPSINVRIIPTKTREDINTVHKDTVRRKMAIVAPRSKATSA
jgi:hypothetical protein